MVNETSVKSKKYKTQHVGRSKYCWSVMIDDSLKNRGRSVLHFIHAASKLNFLQFQQKGNSSSMLLARDYVAYMATEIVKRLVEGNLIETNAAPEVALRIRQRMNEELAVEDRLNDEVRQILQDHQDEMRRTGVSYQEMYKKVKGQLARDRKLVLR
jgi:uncharacterized protein DUF507